MKTHCFQEETTITDLHETSLNSEILLQAQLDQRAATRSVAERAALTARAFDAMLQHDPAESDAELRRSFPKEFRQVDPWLTDALLCSIIHD